MNNRQRSDTDIRESNRTEENIGKCTCKTNSAAYKYFYFNVMDLTLSFFFFNKLQHHKAVFLQQTMGKKLKVAHLYWLPHQQTVSYIKLILNGHENNIRVLRCLRTDVSISG